MLFKIDAVKRASSYGVAIKRESVMLGADNRPWWTGDLEHWN